MRIEIPVKVVSRANQRVSWQARHTKDKKQREAAAIFTANVINRLGKEDPPYRITFVASLKRLMDDDNLANALKPIRDGVCQSLGVDDSTTSPVEFLYFQVQGPYGVAVEIEHVEVLAPRVAPFTPQMAAGGVKRHSSGTGKTKLRAQPRLRHHGSRKISRHRRDVRLGSAQ